MSGHRVRELFDRETATFEAANPRSRELFERSGNSLFGGVPMSWMMKWAGAFPLFAASAVRMFARTATFIPMKPAAADRTAPIRKPNAVPQPSLL